MRKFNEGGVNDKDGKIKALEDEIKEELKQEKKISPIALALIQGLGTAGLVALLSWLGGASEEVILGASLGTGGGNFFIRGVIEYREGVKRVLEIVKKTEELDKLKEN